MQKGLFVVLEGPEGSSKTTQSKLLSKWLADNDVPHMQTREPDGPIRDILLDSSNDYRLHPDTELLLFTASRVNKYKLVIEPALQRGQVVICDRYLESSLAYQGYANGLGMNLVHQLHDMFIQDNRITILLDVPLEISLQRIASRSCTLDRIEQREIEYHKKVIEGYELLSTSLNDVYVIDATKDAQTIHENIKDILGPKLMERGFTLKCP